MRGAHLINDFETFLSQDSLRALNKDDWANIRPRLLACAHVFQMGSSSGLEPPHDSLHSALALCSDWGEGESCPEPEREPDK